MALVKINLSDIFGEGFSSRVVFAPLETPWINGDWSLVATKTTEVVTNSAGLADVTLLAGQYRVTFPRYTEDVLTIGVPDDGGEYDFALLINAGGTNIPTPPHWQGPQGEAATIAIDSTETLAPGESATVENIGDENNAALKFGIPKGDKGVDGNAATISVDSVETVEPGQPAEVTNIGTESAAALKFKIPRGEDGDPGKDYTRAHEALTGTAIDLSSGSDIIYYATLSGAVTYTFDGAANGTIALIRFSNTGGHAVTWPGTVQWMMGVPPPDVLPDGCMVMLIVINGVVIGGWA
ncbi:MAG TPA: hypothetical protein VNQ90_15645 [Chthoniobacteraceae bacterium]|nr:hypothetical protein [Chthoniobacteraceae bacterium]